MPSAPLVARTHEATSARRPALIKLMACYRAVTRAAADRHAAQHRCTLLRHVRVAVCALQPQYEPDRAGGGRDRSPRGRFDRRAGRPRLGRFLHSVTLPARAARCWRARARVNAVWRAAGRTPRQDLCGDQGQRGVWALLHLVPSGHAPYRRSDRIAEFATRFGTRIRARVSHEPSTVLDRNRSIRMGSRRARRHDDRFHKVRLSGRGTRA